MEEFYRYARDAFEKVAISDLRVGDKMALGNNGSTALYGIVEVSDITRAWGGSVVVDYILPIGASIISTDDRHLAVSTINGAHVVEASERYNASEHLLILKSQ